MMASYVVKQNGEVVEVGGGGRLVKPEKQQEITKLFQTYQGLISAEQAGVLRQRLQVEQGLYIDDGQSDVWKESNKSKISIECEPSWGIDSHKWRQARLWIKGDDEVMKLTGYTGPRPGVQETTEIAPPEKKFHITLTLGKKLAECRVLTLKNKSVKLELWNNSGVNILVILPMDGAFFVRPERADDLIAAMQREKSASRALYADLMDNASNYSWSPSSPESRLLGGIDRSGVYPDNKFKIPNDPELLRMLGYEQQASTVAPSHDRVRGRLERHLLLKDKSFGFIHLGLVAYNGMLCFMTAGAEYGMTRRHLIPKYLQEDYRRVFLKLPRVVEGKAALAVMDQLEALNQRFNSEWPADIKKQTGDFFELGADEHHGMDAQDLFAGSIVKLPRDHELRRYLGCRANVSSEKVAIKPQVPKLATDKLLTFLQQGDPMTDRTSVFTQTDVPAPLPAWRDAVEKLQANNIEVTVRKQSLVSPHQVRITREDKTLQVQWPRNLKRGAVVKLSFGSDFRNYVLGSSDPNFNLELNGKPVGTFHQVNATSFKFEITGHLSASLQIRPEEVLEGVTLKSDDFDALASVLAVFPDGPADISNRIWSNPAFFAQVVSSWRFSGMDYDFDLTIHAGGKWEMKLAGAKTAEILGSVGARRAVPSHEISREWARHAVPLQWVAIESLPPPVVPPKPIPASPVEAAPLPATPITPSYKEEIIDDVLRIRWEKSGETSINLVSVEKFVDGRWQQVRGALRAFPASLHISVDLPERIARLQFAAGEWLAEFESTVKPPPYNSGIPYSRHRPHPSHAPSGRNQDRFQRRKALLGRIRAIAFCTRLRRYFLPDGRDGCGSQSGAQSRANNRRGFCRGAVGRSDKGASGDAGGRFEAC